MSAAGVRVGWVWLLLPVTLLLPLPVVAPAVFVLGPSARAESLASTREDTF